MIGVLKIAWETRPFGGLGSTTEEVARQKTTEKYPVDRRLKCVLATNPRLPPAIHLGLLDGDEGN